MVTSDEGFEAASVRAAALVGEALRRVLAELDAELALEAPSAPLAPFAAVRSRDGRLIARVSAHADGASVLLGEAGTLCAFDAGTPEERAQRVAGAVAAAVALETTGS